MRSIVLLLLLLSSPSAQAAPRPEGAAPASKGSAAAPMVTAAPAAAPALVTPAPAVPTQALIEKLGAGDRAFLAAEYRPALFAYLDAAYLDPTSAVARIRLARAYTALGHRERAAQQLRQALELDPGSAEAQRLVEELAGTAVPPAGPTLQGVTLPAAPAQSPGPPVKAYRLSEETRATPPPAPAMPVPPPVVDQPAPARP